MAVTTPRDLLRLELGDTDQDAPLFYDDELDAFLLAHADDVLRSAAAACEALATRFARAYAVTEDGQAWDRQQMAQQYAQRARELHLRCPPDPSYPDAS